MKAVNFKIIHQLAIPATISGISEPLLSLTDTAIVGRIPEQGAAALAAAGAVGAFLSTLIWVFRANAICFRRCRLSAQRSPKLKIHKNPNRANLVF